MFTNYSISGEITYDNGTRVDAEYTLYNITKDFKSDTKTSINGYYNINIMDYNQIPFDNNDILLIVFRTNIDGNDYFNTIYNIIDYDKNINDIPCRLATSWNYETDIDITRLSRGKYRINIDNTSYQKNYIELYYKHDDKYVLIENFFITTDSVDITFKFNGDYLFKVYAIANERLYSHDTKELSVVDIVNTSIGIRRYIEWE